MLNSLREWGERRSTRIFALKIAQKRLEFEGVCTVTRPYHKTVPQKPRHKNRVIKNYPIPISGNRIVYRLAV